MPCGLQAEEPYWLGVAWGGILNPLALKESDRWKAPWSDSRLEPSKLEGVRTLQQIPKEWLGSQKAIPKRWKVFSPKASAQYIRVVNVVPYSTMDAVHLGLKMEPAVEGIATTGNQAIFPMVVISDVSSEAERIKSVIVNEFYKKEAADPVEFIKKNSDAACSGQGDCRICAADFPDDKTRLKASVHFESLIRTSRLRNGSRLYYFRGLKDYPVQLKLIAGSKKIPCPQKASSRAQLRGWIRETEGRALELLDSELELGYKDPPVKVNEAGGEYNYDPLAVVEDYDMPLFLLRHNGYETGWYSLSALDKSGRMIKKLHIVSGTAHFPFP